MSKNVVRLTAINRSSTDSCNGQAKTNDVSSNASAFSSDYFSATSSEGEDDLLGNGNDVTSKNVGGGVEHASEIQGLPIVLPGISVRHAANLRKVASLVLQLGPQFPLKMVEDARERGCMWSTIHTLLGTVLGAAKRSPQVKRIVENSNIKDVLRMVILNKIREETFSSVKPISKEEFAQVREELSGTDRLYADVVWSTGQRPGDVTKLRSRNIQAYEDSILVTMAEGKGAISRKRPFVVSAVLPSAKALLPLLTRPKPFTKKNQIALSGAMKRHGLCLKSLRRGSLTLMAQGGVSEPVMMSISGHTTPATLMRYLDWGRSFKALKEGQLGATRLLWQN